MEATDQEITVGTYFMEWWRSLPNASRRRWWLGLGLFGVMWLVGAALAPSTAAGIGALNGLTRLGSALFFGGFSFLWWLLVALGHISESAAEPSLLWLPLAVVMPGLVVLFLIILSQPPNPRYGLHKLLEKAAAKQGRIEAAKIAETLAIERGLPLALAADRKDKKRLVGLDYERLEGHVLVTAPTRAGKGLHLTETLLRYPGPAFILDPKGEQYERTAAWRRQWGPIYRVPGHQVHLAGYYRHLRNRDDAYELHYHLLRPWQGRESIFAEKSLSLFHAVGAFAQAHKRNAIRLLLDLAESNPQEALAALRSVPEARRHVDIFTNGASPQEYHHDRFVTSALGNFTARLAPYQSHIDTIAPPDLKQRDKIIPPEWAERNGTVYLTYSLNDLRAAGGVVAAIVAAVLRYQMRQGSSQRPASPRLLVAIDELPAVGLRNISDYLATVGGYGMTMLLYVQSVAQLHELYGRDGTRAILANCVHQVWYPPAEMETAKLMSELYGTTLKANPVQSSSQGSRQQQRQDGQPYTLTSRDQGASWSWREGAALTANEMMALPQGQVLVATQQVQRQVFLGERVNPIPFFDRLPGPRGLGVPQPLKRARGYTDWTALAEAAAAGLTGQAAGGAAGRQKKGQAAGGQANETNVGDETGETGVIEGEFVAHSDDAAGSADQPTPEPPAAASGVSLRLLPTPPSPSTDREDKDTGKQFL